MRHELARHTEEPRYRVVGKHVVGRGQLVLPAHRCVKCGSTEPGGQIQQHRVNYVNPLIWLTFFISGLITLAAYFLTKKPIDLQYYLCPKCEDRRRIARVTVSLVGITSMIGMAASVVGGPFEVFLGAFLIALVARLLLIRSPLRPVAHDDGWIALQGASPTFLAALSGSSELAGPRALEA